MFHQIFEQTAPWDIGKPVHIKHSAANIPAFQPLITRLGLMPGRRIHTLNKIRVQASEKGKRDVQLTSASTAAEDEVSRFSAIAEEWWDENGKFRPLHLLNPVRVQFVRDTVCNHLGRNPNTIKPLSGLKILDVGCGGGLLSEPLSRMGARVTAIDAGEETIVVAKTHAEQMGLSIEFQCATPEQLASGDHAVYDCVVSLEVVEHVSDLPRFLGAVSELTAPGNGVLILGTINRTFKSLALAKVAAEYILRWVPAGTHDWNKFVQPSELAPALKKHNVSISDVQGIIYDPVRGIWRLGRDTAVNYLAAFKKGTNV